MENTKYYKKEKNIYRFRVEQDDDAPNPRTENDNLAHMICWNRYYDLGDDHEYESQNQLLDEMIHENYSDLSIYRYIKKNKSSNNIELIYDRKEKEYQLIGDYRVWWNGGKVHHGVIASQPSKEWLVDDILDALPIPDKIHMLERKGYMFMPLSIYDHSGITMYIGNSLDHYDGQFDCSNVGFIYVNKNEVARNVNVTNKNWKWAAELVMRLEVEVYDQYLKGYCYGYIIEELDQEMLKAGHEKTEEIEADDSYWEHNISSWGYYSDKCGDALIEELFSGAVGDVTIHNSLAACM